MWRCSSSLWLDGAISLPLLKDVLRDTMVVTGALFALLIGATVFTLIVRAFGTDRWVTSLLAGRQKAAFTGRSWP